MFHAEEYESKQDAKFQTWANNLNYVRDMRLYSLGLGLSDQMLPAERLDIDQFDFEAFHHFLVKTLNSRIGPTPVDVARGLIDYFSIQTLIMNYRGMLKINADGVKEGEFIIQTLVGLELIKVHHRVSSNICTYSICPTQGDGCIIN